MDVLQKEYLLANLISFCYPFEAMNLGSAAKYGATISESGFPGGHSPAEV